MAKIGRNEPCPCGSGLKYKKCCGDFSKPGSVFSPENQTKIPPGIELTLQQAAAEQRIRQQQQGLGNPIVSMEHMGYRIVCVGNQLYYSKKWKTFHDFLIQYIKYITAGDSWGNNELKKPVEQMHPIIQWYRKVCEFQKEEIKEPGNVNQSHMIGVVEAYMYLSYNLYLIAHNTIKNQYDKQLQSKLIQRLKLLESFPGALYETYVCAWLVKAGFEVSLVDDKKNQKSCDFIVTSRSSKNKYTVEAKSIRRAGSLGATQNTTNQGIRKSVRNQLYDALKKRSDYPRIIFIDLNLSECTPETVEPLFDQAIKSLHEAEDLTINGNPTDPAYVFFTNFPYHYHLNKVSIAVAVLYAGYKIPDFGDGAKFSNFIEMYHAKQKHADIYRIIESQKTHRTIPSTFDGSLPSEAFLGLRERIKIGQTYLFEDIGEEGLIATVTTATVNEVNKEIIIGTDKGHILKEQMTDDQFHDYLQHPDSYFGVIEPDNKKTENPFELFELFFEVYSKTPKEKLLEFMKDSPELENLKQKNQDELALIYCNGITNSIVSSSGKSENN